MIAQAPRVDCPGWGPTVGQVPWARHDSAFTRPFEDLVVWEAIASSKQTAADRYAISWRAVNNACVRVATEALEDTVNSFFDALGAERSARLEFVTCDGAEWIRTVVADRTDAVVCLDPFHLVSWATKASTR